MIDWLRGPSALRRRRPLCAWLPGAELPCAEPPAEAADGLPAEQPVASRHAPATRTPAQVAGLREMVLRGASAVMPMGRRYRRRGSAPMVTTWHRCYLAHGTCRPGPTGSRPRPPCGPPAPG